MSNVPEIRVPPPGPNARKLIERDERVISPSYTRVYPLVVDRAEGAVVEDVDGNRFLDFTAGIAVCATGHCHPRLVRAIQEQSARLLHMSGSDFYYEPLTRLAEKLTELAPGEGPKRAFFCNSGAEAVEAAIKLARFHTKRRRIIAFHGAFHGRTLGALSLTASKTVQRRGFGPLLPGVTHVEYPNPFRHGSDAHLRVLDHIEGTLFHGAVPPEEVAAIVVEPIQGEGGYIVPPEEFHPRLAALAARHGILYVADEVQSGMGRTGRMFASEHFGVAPDILCLAKGLASGMPLGAILARDELMDWPPGAHASTFGGNPVCCVAALETIALLEEGLMTNAAAMGELLQKELRGLQRRHERIGDVRGLGLMVGVEIVRGRESNAPAPKLRDELVGRCFAAGLLLLGCGENSIRFCPPLIVNDDDVRTAIRLFDKALTEA